MNSVISIVNLHTYCTPIAHLYKRYKMNQKQCLLFKKASQYMHNDFALG
jgi:hypothetical protein